jgi:hypothetical protein
MAAFATAPTTSADHFYAAEQSSSIRHRASFDQSQLSAGFAEQPQRHSHTPSGSSGGGGGSLRGSLAEGGALAAAFPEDPGANAMASLSDAQRLQLGVTLSAALDSPHLSAAFTEAPFQVSLPQQLPPQPPRLGASFEQHRGSFDAHQQQQHQLMPSSAELDSSYLGSPPRSDDPALIGSPAARSAIGSPVPNAGRLASPPADCQPGVQHLHMNGDARHEPAIGGGPGAEHCKLVILGLPWDTTEETLQV